MNNNKLERSLVRQLKHAGLSLDQIPTNLNNWQTFLVSVNRSFIGNKDARYLLEKSLDQSSHELRDLYDNLKEESEQRIKALQQSEDKSRFMASMSHEIRTPIHGILGSLEIIKKSTDLDNKQKQFINTAFSSAESLLAIINNILDFSKIGADKIPLERIDFNLHKLVNDVSNVASAMVHKKPLTVSCDIHRDVPEMLNGDPTKTRQILTNLISNSVKFTHEGSIKIQITLLNTQTKQYNIRISVEDTGIGISEKAQKNIFEPFVQEDTSTTRKYGGTGLGLALIKEFTEMMEGEISIESTQGKGSRFWVDIPFGHASKITGSEEIAQPILEREIKNESEQKKYKNKKETQNTLDQKQKADSIDLILAEDNQVNALIAKTMIAQMGLNVKHVPNGKQAFDEISSGKPYKLVLMDMHMPIMDGYEATKSIRQWEKEQSASPIPIIAMTANSLAGDRDKCIASGMDDFLPKPVTQDYLKKVIFKWLEKYNQTFLENDDAHKKVRSPGACPRTKKRLQIPQTSESNLIEIVK